ncbi:MAG: hypothetical protein K2X73_04825 [Sphingomonas sp.]|uniref:hypothetical protein n=1 Tax=Sphingomonas sp. TaxID=28214 RepID=UPI0025CE9D22|nr:hypothetical protein [Sphingomonas sp.]MBX9881278.1 hypothetical protein [Sphingomonas sp.]
MTVATMRSSGTPSPLEAGTHDANIAGLAPPIPFDLGTLPIAGAAQVAERFGLPGLPEISAAIGSTAAVAKAVLGEGASAAPVDATDDLAEAEAPAWLGATAKLIRPLCVGALMAIPTVGAASVGIVAMFSPATALGMADASTRFLAGIPGDIVVLIGALAGGYTAARSAEKIVGLRR